jgi:hypothetical protein
VRSCAQRGRILPGSTPYGCGETVINISTSVFVSLQADELPAGVQVLRKRYYLHPLRSYYRWPSIILRQSRRRPTGYWRGHTSSSVKLEIASHLWATCHTHSASRHCMERVTMTHYITSSGTFGHSNGNELYRRDTNTSFSRSGNSADQIRFNFTWLSLCIPTTVLLGN